MEIIFIGGVHYISITQEQINYLKKVAKSKLKKAKEDYDKVSSTDGSVNELEIRDAAKSIVDILQDIINLEELKTYNKSMQNFYDINETLYQRCKLTLVEYNLLENKHLYL